MQHFFADGLGALSISNGVVRIEFCVQGKTPNREKEKNEEGSKTVLSPTCSINVPVENFANMLGHFQSLVDKLEKDGLLKRQTVQKPSSPNFN